MEFHYVPPPGWLGVRRLATTIWVRPRYPRAPSTITVLDARPFGGSVDQPRDRHVLGRSRDRFVACAHDELEDCGRNLEGRLRIAKGTVAGRRVVRAGAALADMRFMYLARLETAEVEDLAVFRALIDSIEPVRCTSAGDLTTIWRE